MQTGYDSFWMYQNNRHEPVPNLPKNDNQSHAVLTDSYKQVQSGGHPSLLNSCIPPQNNIARSNNQHRTPHSQYVWPSSVYSRPLKPSYASNFHPQAAFSAQSNNSGYSSPYTQPNLTDGGDLRNFKNPNTSIFQVQNRNSNNQNSNSIQIRDNQNYNPHTGRIRVRDVFSLNKSTVPSEVPNSNSYQREQYGNYNYNSAYAAKNQSQFVNYGRGSLPPANHLPPPYYASRQVADHPGSAQHFQPSSPSFYQQNSESQHQFLTSRPVDRNRNFEASKTNPQNTSLLQELLYPRANHDPFAQVNRRVSSESIHENEIVKDVPQRNLVQVNDSVRTITPAYGNPLDVNNVLTCENSNINNVSLIQNQQDNNTSFRSNSSSASASANVKSPVFQNSTGQETVIKISIPHSGQSTFITLSDCVSTNKSSSLPCLLDENDKFCSEWNQKNPNHDNNAKEKNVTDASVPQTRHTSLINTQIPSSVNLLSSDCHNSDSENLKNLTVPPRKRFCQVREPFLDLNKENLNAFLNSTPLSENSSENSISRIRDSESIARETTFQEKITLSAFQLKQENLNAAVESPGRDSNVPEKKVLLEIIKREKNPIDDNTETQENSTAESMEETDSAEEGPSASEVEFTEESNADVKGFGFLPEVPVPHPGAEVVSENSTEQAEKLNNPTDKRKDLPTGNNEEKSQNCLPVEVNYKSRINRNKLDMLIQFLEMDEESVVSVHKTTCTKSRKETDLNHNRRKLSKNSVVKNKNNSREMIAMKSNKNSRVETSKCSPPSAVVAKPNSDKEGERRNPTEEKSKADESENNVKSNPSEVVQREGENSSEKSEPKNINGLAETRSEVESEECSAKQDSGIQKAEDLFNKYRALQTSKTVFCGKCNLFSAANLFWVNLATGELDCLNCFKRITLQPESNTDGKTSRKEKSENSREYTLEQSSENNFKETCKTKCSSKSETAEGVSKSIKEAIKQEPVDSVELPMSAKKEPATALKGSNREERQTKSSQDRSKGDTKNGKLKRRESISKESCSAPKPPKEGSASVKATSVETLKKEQTAEQSLRKNNSKEHQDVGKKQESVRKSTQKEEEVAGSSAKEKKCAEGSEQIRKRSDSKDFVSCKSPEEQKSKKETRTDSTESNKSVKKTKECGPAPKDNSTEPVARKSTKQEHSEKAKSVSKESNTSHKPKESDSSEETRTKSTNSSEKYKKIDSTGVSRKRKNSDEDTAPVKVRIVEDQTKKDLKPVQHRINTSSALKDDIEKHKTKTTNGEMQSTKNSAQKVKRSSLSKDDGEHISSSSKEKEEALKVDANYQKIKAYEQAKQKVGDSTEVTRKKSKEEQVVHKHAKKEVKQVVETSEKRKNKQDDGEPWRHGSVATENKERKKTEEKEKNHSSRKLDTSSRLLKENQNTKVRSEKNKDIRERKKSSEERKDDNKEKEPTEKDDKKRLENCSEKKKLPDRLEGKSSKIQTENRHGKAFEKMLEGYLGSKTESGALTKDQGKHSAQLLSKLIKKTKKLSWSLLNEA